MDENKDVALHRVEIGRLKVLKAVNRKLYRVEIWALNDKVNRNGWKYVNLDSHLSEFQDIPILTAYLRNGQVIGDGHNFDMKTDPGRGNSTPPLPRRTRSASSAGCRRTRTSASSAREKQTGSW